MANATTPRSSVMAAETCTPRSGKSAKGFGVCLPSTSKSGTSTAVSHHPVLSASLPEPSSKLPPESLPILLPIIYSPSGHPEARSSWPVTSDLHAVTKSSSGKPSQSSLVFSQFVATVRPYPTHSPVSALVNTATWPLIPNSHVPNCRNSYSARDGLPSNAYYEPLWSSPTTTSLRIASTSSENPGRLQSIYSTVTYEVTETPQSTFPTPASIAETTDGQSTVSVPPSIISTGQITPGDGPVASATHAISSPVEDASVSHSFFGNHAAVVSVFLACGIAIACAVVIGLYYYRRRKVETEHIEKKILDISPPLPQNPFTIRKPYGPSSNRTKQTFFSVPLNRSGERLPVLPVAHSTIDKPLPKPVPQLRKSRSSHRVPVPYSSLDAHQGNSQTADRQYDGPFSDRHPAQVVPPLPTLNMPPPPPLPERSPLRLLAVKSLNNSLNTPPEYPNRLSGASSVSLYPPSSSSTSEAVVAPENNSGMEHGRRKTGQYTQALGLSIANSSGASSSWLAQRSLVENPASGTGPAQTSILDEVTRMYNARQLVGYKAG